MILTVEKTMERKTNATDPSRKHTVSGTVYKNRGGNFEAVREGRAYTNDNVFLADFNCGVSESLNINFCTSDITSTEQRAVIADIMEFIDTAKETA